MFQKKYICSMVLFISIFTIFCYCVVYSDTTPVPTRFIMKDASQPILIAHAAGKIDGHTYTNSLEALEQAFRKGYDFIELDILETCDGYLVGAHDWKHFNKITNFDENAAQCVEEKAFSQRKIFKKFTPLDAERISALFNENPAAYLVTDKIVNFAAIKEQLTIPNERLLVEVFSYEQYVSALRHGIKYPMLCVWNNTGLKKHMELLLDGKIAIITMAKKDLDISKKELQLIQKNNVSVFVFTENDANIILEYPTDYVTGFYTDVVSNEDIKNAK